MTDHDRRPQQSLLCPVCRVDLVMSERQNVETDYCPRCRGVWLDRGELDKIIERSAAPSVQDAVPEPAQRGYRDYQGQPDDRWRQGHRRKSWLSDIFD
jgi:Zn-finger nucleic acid-binding protein